MGINLVAILWGFAEGTLFLIVPDVWLSIVGRNKLLIGLVACIYSLAGALVGGLIIYLWGAYDLEKAHMTIEKVPAVSPDMMARVYLELSEQGVLAIMLGPLRGTPYKVYAVHAADIGIGLWQFVLISIPARIIRFVLVTSCCHFALKAIGKLNIKTDPLVILLTGWVIFYAYYFLVMPG